jgi:Tol biopolymer transport system component
VYLRDLVAQTTAAVSTAQDGFALDPAISADGRVIAYTSVVGGTSRVLVHDMTTGVTQVASRATGAAGGPADGDSRDPSISADGTRVAFASAATNLSASKPDDSRGVFVRDLVAQTTTLVSSPAGAP